MSFLRRLYQRLPVIRELNRIVTADIAHHTHFLKHAHTATIEQAVRALQNAAPDPRDLICFEAQTCSQNGEDGIIQELCRRLGITVGTFLEIGVEDGLENNSHALLGTGWSGTWIECDPQGCAAIRRHFPTQLAAGALRLIDTAITPENIAALIPVQAVDFASIDIDLNTYHVCAQIVKRCTPRIAVIEYNPAFPPGVEWICPYQTHGVWDRSMVYGASLTAYERLMATLGYSLVGCDLTGNNAFFVQSSDVASDCFAGPFTAERHYQPPRFHITGRRGNMHRLAPLPPVVNPDRRS